MLLRNFSFHDIVTSLQEKFGSVPFGWESELVKAAELHGFPTVRKNTRIVSAGTNFQVKKLSQRLNLSLKFFVNLKLEVRSRG
jgi:hypothetical protein